MRGAVVRHAIETLAIILAAGLVANLLARLLRLPEMVVLLAAGIVIGPHAAGWLSVSLESLGVQLLLSLGVSIILFYGGFGLSLRVLSRVGVGLGLLAVPGVILTAVVTGLVAAAAFGIPVEAGILIGAVVAPTDPAILIPLFERLRVRAKVVQTVIAESALNDPTGAVLALALAAFVVEGGGSLADPLTDFAVDLGISTGLGIGFGLLLAAVVSERRLGIWRDSPTIVVAAVVALSYFTIDSAGGSGYLGAFIAGLIVGNAGSFGLHMGRAQRFELATSISVLTHVMVLFIFVVLGANLPLDTMADNALPAVAAVAALVLVARPLTVAACLLPDRRGTWTRQEMTFVGWTRETGVVPASVAALLAAEGVPYQSEIVTVVALAIVVTLLVQATTKPWLARRLGLAE
jgi:cell volume regulation protein A